MDKLIKSQHYKFNSIKKINPILIKKFSNIKQLTKIKNKNTKIFYNNTKISKFN